jgi:restriction endonuclease Mrr
MNTISKETLKETLVEAYTNLGGAATHKAVYAECVNVLGLDDSELDPVGYNPYSNLTYRLSWAQHELKKSGVLTWISRGYLALTKVEEKY